MREEVALKKSRINNDWFKKIISHLTEMHKVYLYETLCNEYLLRLHYFFRSASSSIFSAIIVEWAEYSKIFRKNKQKKIRQSNLIVEKRQRVIKNYSYNLIFLNFFEFFQANCITPSLPSFLPNKKKMSWKQILSNLSFNFYQNCTDHCPPLVLPLWELPCA